MGKAALLDSTVNRRPLGKARSLQKDAERRLNDREHNDDAVAEGQCKVQSPCIIKEISEGKLVAEGEKRGEDNSRPGVLASPRAFTI